MDRSKLYTHKTGNFVAVCAEGSAMNLEEGIKRYKLDGRYRGGVDFTSILRGDSDNEIFVVANIYGNPFCSLTVAQNKFNQRNSDKTILACYGNRQLPLDFLDSFAEIIDLNPSIVSHELVRQAEQAKLPLILNFQKYLSKGEDFAAMVLSYSLRKQQQEYERNAMVEARANN